MKRALLVSIVLAAGAVLPAAAQITGAVRVTLAMSDDISGPGAGIELTLSGPALMSSRTTVTNERGEAWFLGVPPGDRYQLRTSLPGFGLWQSELSRVFAGRELDLRGSIPRLRYGSECGTLHFEDRNVPASHTFSLPIPRQPPVYVCL